MNKLSSNFIFWAIAGQLGLFTGILISYLLEPKYLENGGGISNYGVLSRTVLFYSLGFLISAVCTLKCGHLLAKTKNPKLYFISHALTVLSILYGLVLLSTFPYKLNNSLNILHQFMSTFLFLYMVFLGIYITLIITKNVLTIGLGLGLLTGVAIAVFTFYGVVDLLFVGEVMTGLLFGIILVRYLHSYRNSVKSD